MPALFLLALALLHSVSVQGQTDTLLRYDVRTRQWQSLPEVPAGEVFPFDSTCSFLGNLGNAVVMPLDPPVNHLFPGSSFSDLAVAAGFFPLTSYPARTAVKLFGYQNDSVRHNCSGILVGNRFVLTAAHCLITFGVWNNDSLLAAPAYDMGRFHPSMPASMVDRYYFFSSWYHNFQRDIALLQLREPVGQQAGWVGMAYAREDGFFLDKVFHKFSYPSAPSLVDTNRKYNGDTLYYNYGLIEPGADGFLTVPGPLTVGIPGQSGSALFYTDNRMNVILGVMNYASQYRHFRIDPYVFRHFRDVIEQNDGFNTGPQPSGQELLVYPNPFRESAVVQLVNPEFPSADLRLFDAAGRFIRQQSLGKDGRTVLMRTDLTAGLYYLYLFFSGKLMTGKKVIVF